jgi:hypothetical protein
VKKLLIIQLDDPYFLFETLQVLEKSNSSTKDFDITVLANEKSIEFISNNLIPLMKGLTSDVSKTLSQNFDLCVNLSLHEKSWEYQAEAKSIHKVGVYKEGNKIIVDDPWTTYLLTLKEKAPFLTFHLRDIYKNILGIKSSSVQKKMIRLPIKQIAYGSSATHLFSADEQENFITGLTQKFSVPIVDITEVDLIEDVSRTLYIGPSNLEVLQFCESGGKSIILTSSFQGFNLLPYSGDHLVISSGGGTFLSAPLMKIIENDIFKKSNSDSPYSIYEVDSETFNGSFIKPIKSVDGNYPFYQTHLILWNFLLNMSDVHLEIMNCSETQLSLIKTNTEALKKLIRLYDYALVSIDQIYQQAKSLSADPKVIEEHIKNLLDVDHISTELAKSHRLLRPFLDFYRIRRNQNFGTSLLEHSQNNYLLYAEEHQALKGLMELLSVTIKKNEATIS